MPTNQPYDLLYIINLLLSRWRFIIGGTLVIMVMAAAGTFIAEETYESSAKLLVSSPKFVGGLDVFPREINEPTVGQMAQSGVVYEDLIRVLWALREALAEVRDDRERALGTAKAMLASGSQELAARFGWEPSDAKVKAVLALKPDDIAGVRLADPEDLELLDARTLAEMLEVKAEIEFESASQIRWEPLIELKAKGNTPETAASIANIWARITLEQVREAVELGTRDALGQLTEAYQAAQQSLELVQERIKELNQKEMGELKRARLNGLLELLYGHGVELKRDPLYRQYSDTLARISELEKAIAGLKQHLAAIEVEGEWIGSLALAREGAGGAEPVSATAEEVVRRRDALVRANQALRKFKEQNPIAVEQARLAEGTRRLEDLRSQRSTFAAMVKLSPTVEGGTTELSLLDRRIEELDRMIAETNDRIAAMEQGLREKELEATRAEDEWAAYRKEYLRLRQQLFTQEEESLSKGALAASLERQIADTMEEVDRLNTEIEEYGSRVSGLEAELAAKQQAFDEVTKLHAQIGVASRTPFVSLKLVSAAPIPKTRVSPKRSIVVLVAGFIGAVLLCGWVIARENLGRYRMREGRV